MNQATELTRQEKLLDRATPGTREHEVISERIEALKAVVPKKEKAAK